MDGGGAKTIVDLLPGFTDMAGNEGWFFAAGFDEFVFVHGAPGLWARLTNRVNRRCRSGAEGSDVASQRQRPG